MRFSRKLAVVIGIAAPLLDTVRRWSTWRADPARLLDDYVLGAMLLGAVWLYRRDPVRGRVALAGAWGIAFAGVTLSAWAQWDAVRAGRPDPAPVSPATVLVVKMAGAALAGAALVSTIAARRP